jgi:hypothetical protein
MANNEKGIMIEERAGEKLLKTLIEKDLTPKGPPPTIFIITTTTTTTSSSTQGIFTGETGNNVTIHNPQIYERRQDIKSSNATNNSTHLIVPEGNHERVDNPSRDDIFKDIVENTPYQPQGTKQLLS